MDRLDGEPDSVDEPDQPPTPAEKILDLVGPAVLLNVRRGDKAPTKKAWQQMTLADITPEYLADLTNNIGVSLGAASDGLFTIDCDDDEGFQEILAINPMLEGTLQSHGARGGNFWLRIEGDAPPKTGKLKRSDGSAVGEWRGDGSQTLLHGIHPTGVHYRHNDTPVVTTPFSEIVWPETWKRPWAGKDEGAVAPAAAHADSQEVEGGPKPRMVVECMLNSIPPRPDRDTWLKISAAVRNSLGNDAAAIEMLKAWSPEEEMGEYEQLLSSSPFAEIGYGTLVHHAKLHGFRGVTDRFFYNGRTFYMRGETEFIPLGSEGAVKQHITKFGVPKAHHNDLLCYIREHHFMHHIGPLAGYGVGVHYFEGTRALVTTGPNIISGAQGSADFIDRFFLTLLQDESHPEQFPTFLNWLAHCRRAVVEGRRRQSPAVALTGGIGYGKTLTIDIIRKCLGGRSAKAYRFLSGDTHFNAEIVGAELLVVDDDAASKDHRARVRLAQSIKTNLFSSSVRIEGKGRDAYSLDPIQAILFAVNDDPEHIRVLPELDESMLDKICLIKTNPGEIPEDIRGQEELIGAAVDAALPAFLSVLDARDLSGAYAQSGRLRCFWHPEIVQAVLDINGEKAADVVSAIQALGRKSLAIKCDVGYADQVARSFEAAEAFLGGLDILVNNTGVIRFSKIVDMPEEDWDHILRTNLKSAFLCSQQGARRMIKQGTGGRIVSISSIHAVLSEPNCGHYTAAKGGIEAFSRTLASELAPHKITVNFIRPGATFTELTTPMYTDAVKRSLFERVPLKEIAEASWIASGAVFLASEDSRYMTGQSLTMDGGYVMDGSLPSAEYCKE